eukprot:CAMPEP_0185281122 /NCGR_PEP_ID=MMETSP1359-20130426/66541_1 /TAXON_ID=552665 /ORGANISM="Bigelowiella longifila, Strain CCMP242" /LENGTH=221 /DNA_ID=CAMNT_0027876515 /DNA_START=221 /DNA_END=886 /DNA_ORIENTATION=-
MMMKITCSFRCYCIPIRDFGKHGFETPPRHVHIVFFSPPGEVAKCQRFLTLHARLFPSYSLLEYSKDLSRYAASKGILEFGASPPGRLLFPMNPLLHEEIERIESSQGGGVGTALDIGCGSGRDVVRLLCRGWIVFGIDNMKKALERCEDLATRQGYRKQLHTICVALKEKGSLERVLLKRRRQFDGEGEGGEEEIKEKRRRQQLRFDLVLSRSSSIATRE